MMIMPSAQFVTQFTHKQPWFDRDRGLSANLSADEFERNRRIVRLLKFMVSDDSELNRGFQPITDPTPLANKSPAGIIVTRPVSFGHNRDPYTKLETHQPVYGLLVHVSEHSALFAPWKRTSEGDQESLVVRGESTQLSELTVDEYLGTMATVQPHRRWAAISDSDVAAVTAGVSNLGLDREFAVKARAELRDALRTVFQLEPFEDGVQHDAEAILEGVLGNDEALEWIYEFSTDVSQPVFAASVLSCLGRFDSPGTLGWRCKTIRSALMSGDVEMRDAAAVTAHLWRDKELVPILKAHPEPEDWLREYIEIVCIALGE